MMVDPRTHRSPQKMKALYLSKTSRLLQIADISADPYGSIQFTRKCTTIDRPFLVHNPVTGEQVGSLNRLKSGRIPPPQLPPRTHPSPGSQLGSRGRPDWLSR